MKTWVQLSREAHEWSLENFGKQDFSRRVTGFVEEYDLKYWEAMSKLDHDAMRDALADAAIYLLDLAGALEAPGEVCPQGGGMPIGELAQACLQLDQGFLGDDNGEALRRQALDALNNLLQYLDDEWRLGNDSLLDLVNRRWETRRYAGASHMAEGKGR